MLEVNERIQIPLREFDFSYSRSQGPGGQNVNKVNTKVTLHWDIVGTESLPDDVRERFRARYGRRINQAGQLVMTSQRFRDQGRNVADCLNKLRDLILEVATAPRQRRATKPSRASRQRRLDGKRRTSGKKASRRKKFGPDD